MFTAPLVSAIDVVPGRHVVDADVAVGPRSKPVEVAEGQVAHLDFLPPEAPAPPPPPAAPAAAPPPPPEASAPPVRATEAPSDATTTSGASSPARTITTASLGGAAVVAIGLGIYFGLQSRSEASSVNGYLSNHASSYCTVPTPATSSICTQWDNAYQAQNRDGVVSDVAYVAGAVFAAAAAATWFLWPREPRGSAAWVLPEAGPTSAGLRAGIRF